MTFTEAISLDRYEYDLCVATFVKDVTEFNSCVAMIPNGNNRELSCEYGSREDANVFYYYPADCYYGHFNLEELKEVTDVVIMFDMHSKKQKLLNAIKDFL